MPLLPRRREHHPYYLSAESNKDRIRLLWLKGVNDHFSNARPNPYAKKLKSQITINLDVETIDYFKEQAATSGIPYQTLINLYLGDCAKNKRKLTLAWS